LQLFFLCLSEYLLIPVSTVNEYALKGLEKIEEKLPILHQPADKVRGKNPAIILQLCKTFKTIFYLFSQCWGSFSLCLFNAT